MSQTRMVLSAEPDASFVLSGENLRLLTVAVWPGSSLSCLPVARVPNADHVVLRGSRDPLSIRLVAIAETGSAPSVNCGRLGSRCQSFTMRYSPEAKMRPSGLKASDCTKSR
jgi:hypothetical protein